MTVHTHNASTATKCVYNGQHQQDPTGILVLLPAKASDSDSVPPVKQLKLQ